MFEIGGQLQIYILFPFLGSLPSSSQGFFKKGGSKIAKKNFFIERFFTKKSFFFFFIYKNIQLNILKAMQSVLVKTHRTYKDITDPSAMD
jgi:hypothetical protein